MSKYLDMQSVEVLLGFLSQPDDKEDFEDIEDLDEKPKKAKKGKKANGSMKMFEDLQEDVEMS